MKATIITTVKHNVGDDFVREGILYLLERILPSVDAALVHKHIPITARDGMEWLHSAGLVKRLDKMRPWLGHRVASLLDKLPIIAGMDKIHRCEILVQSGAPVYWSNAEGSCDKNEWWGPLIQRRWDKRAKRGLLLNLAAGTCQPYFDDGQGLITNQNVAGYIKAFYSRCALTTVRDELSFKILSKLGCPTEMLPCTSLFATDRLGIAAETGEYVAVNYMRGGGHFELSQGIDPNKWESTIVAIVSMLGASEKCAIVCHNREELAHATRVFPQLPKMYSSRYEDYLKYYARAKYGIMNRVHGAFALASLGKPSIVVGSDSRARMANMIGIESLFVGDASYESLGSAVRRVQEKTLSYPEKIRAIKSHALTRYSQLLGATVKDFGETGDE